MITAYSESASYGARPAYIDWKLKIRCSRSSEKKLATFLSSFLKPPRPTSLRPALHGFTKSSGVSKLASMNESISARYNSSSQEQNLRNEAASLPFENRRISSAIRSRPCSTWSSLPSS